MKKSKIFMLSLFTFVTLFFVKTNVYADVTCPSLGSVVIDDAIPNLVSMIIKVIQIAVPILLVIMGSIDLIKGITSQKEDEIKKACNDLIFEATHIITSINPKAENVF